MEICIGLGSETPNRRQLLPTSAEGDSSSYAGHTTADREWLLRNLAEV